MISNKAKSIFLLSTTLVIGMLLGGGIVGKISQHRVAEARAFTSQEGFEKKMHQLLSARTPEKQQALTETLQRSGKRVQLIFDSSRTRLAVAITDMRNELEGVVPPEQLQRLKKRQQQWRQ